MGNLKSSISIQHHEVLISHNLVLTFFLVVLWIDRFRSMTVNMNDTR